MSYVSYRENLHHVLRRLRMFHDLAQRDMVIRLAVSQSMVSEIEAGKKITLELILKYAIIFDVAASSIFWMAEHYNSPSDVPEIPLSPKATAIMRFLALTQTPAET